MGGQVDESILQLKKTPEWGTVRYTTHGQRDFTPEQTTKILNNIEEVSRQKGRGRGLAVVGINKEVIDNARNRLLK